MRQQHLWQDDGHTVLGQFHLGEIGKIRLKRYLSWLDHAEQDWKRPDLDRYADYLRDEYGLHQETIYQTVLEIKRHYLAVLSNPDHYDHIPEDQRADFVNQVLWYLGFSPLTVRYQYLISDEDPQHSDNMRVLLPDNSNPRRQTQLTTFIHWLNETKRHWLYPDLLDYKEHLLTRDMSSNAIKNAIGIVRQRYHELLEDEQLRDELDADEYRAFVDEFRKRLAYMDEYPSKLHPNREMLEDDTANNNWLTPAQVQEILSSPSPETLVGLRDRAIIALVLATGLYRSELARVQITHLRHTWQGQTALYVPSSISRERYIPYDDYEWVLDWIDQWLAQAEISEGAVFRPTQSKRDEPPPKTMAPETASIVLARYPVTINGRKVSILFGNLRATVARRWYDNGHTLDEIERRLGMQYRPSVLQMLGVKVRDAFG